MKIPSTISVTDLVRNVKIHNYDTGITDNYGVYDLKFSISEGMTVQDGNARWTDERIDRLIREYGASNQDYSQAYAVLMNPRDYLKLTLSG